MVTQNQVLQAKADVVFDLWKRNTNWSEYEVLKVETEFSFPLLNPESEAASRSFAEGGKIDTLLRHKPSGRVVLREAKSTGDPIASDSDYWDKLRMDTQCSKYYLWCLHQKYDIGGIIYDVVRRPAHRLAAVPLRDENGVKIVNDAAGNRVMTKDGKKFRETGDTAAGYVLQTREETIEELTARLTEELNGRPFEFLAQREVPRLDSDIMEYMEDAWSTGQTILHFRKRNLWPRNPAACTAFGTCEFFDLCAGRASVDGVRYGKREKIHAELAIEKSETGLELLTNSRCNALRKCLRYHKLRYEDGVQRIGEESEALYFGTLMHAKWEEFFKGMMQ